MQLAKTPIHQWTDGGDRVLIIKCVDKDGEGYGGFQWPREGPVKPDTCSREATCESGGLFGWAWGVGIGGGKSPDYAGAWIIFSAPPAQVISLGDKVKVAADSPGEVDCRVEYYGDAIGAIMATHKGRIAWTEYHSYGSASNSGYCGSASNSGYYGSASNSGYYGSASNSGYCGSASNSGSCGSASNSGCSGSASNSGSCGSASNNGCSGSASNSGNCGSASNSGYCGSASNSGYCGSASNSGYCGSASNSGYYGSASNSGSYGSASNSGYCGSASNSGYYGSASNSGSRGIAASTGEHSTIDVGASGLGAITASVWYWRVRAGAVVACRWFDGESPGHRLLVADELGLADGSLVKVECGQIVVDQPRGD